MENLGKVTWVRQGFLCCKNLRVGAEPIGFVMFCWHQDGRCEAVAAGHR